MDYRKHSCLTGMMNYFTEMKLIIVASRVILPVFFAGLCKELPGFAKKVYVIYNKSEKADALLCV